MLVRLFEEWDIAVAASGVLTPWDGSALLMEENQNNLWCRKGSLQPWCLDVTIGEGNEEFWVFRRDPAIRIPWDEAVQHTEEGVPYLTPELQLLYKSKEVRRKDELDATEIIPALTHEQRARLHLFLPGDHPWQEVMTE